MLVSIRTPDPAPIVDLLAADGLRLVALVSTRGHVDHVGGVGSVVRSQDHEVPVHIHDADRHMLLDPMGTGTTIGDERRNPFLRQLAPD